MKDSIRRMRPMGIADILDETVELYKTSFVLLMGIAAVLYVPYSICNNYLMMRYYPRLNAHSTNPMDILPFLGAAAVGFLYMMVVTPFVTGAMTYAVSERYLGRRTTVVSSFKRVLTIAVFARMLLAVAVSMAVMIATMGIIGALVFVCVLVGTANTMGLFAAIPISLVLGAGAIFGAVYVMMRLALIDCVIVVELKGIAESFSRTWTLMKGSMLKCLALLAISSLIVAIVQGMIAQPTNSVIMSSIVSGGQPSQFILILHTLIGAVSSTILAPITSIVTILLYYDIRIRKEGFDLELLANELDATARKAPAWAGQPLPQEQAPPEEGPRLQ